MHHLLAGVGITADRRQRDEAERDQAGQREAGGDADGGSGRDRADDSTGHAGADRLAEGRPDHPLEPVDRHQVGLVHE